MHFDLKPISNDAVAKALEKAERYRLLNEPSFAESICLDILAILPSHQQALISRLLARTDQFDHGLTMRSAEEVLPLIEGEYDRAYYAGLIWERQGHAHPRLHDPSTRGSTAHGFPAATRRDSRAEALG